LFELNASSPQLVLAGNFFRVGSHSEVDRLLSHFRFAPESWRRWADASSAVRCHLRTHAVQQATFTDWSNFAAPGATDVDL